jgi:hypothetical protein
MILRQGKANPVTIPRLHKNAVFKCPIDVEILKYPGMIQMPEYRFAAP